MIKIDSENFKIETDCKTVGEFMTQAAAISCGIIAVKVDGCLYELYDNPKIRVTDNTPIDSVFIDSIGSGGIPTYVLRITVLTKPKPKTVTKSGWVNVYAKGDSRITGRTVFASENGAKATPSTDGVARVATVRVVWEEVQQ